MQYVFIIAAVVLAVALYFYVCALLFIYVAVPAMVLGAGLGFAAGAVTGLVVTFMALFGDQGARVLTPADVAAGKLKILRTPTAVRPDFAWPGYFVAQVWLDWWTMAERMATVLRPAWQWSWTQARRSGLVGLACWPLLLPVAVTLIGVTAGAAAVAVLVLTILIVVTGAVWIAGAAVTAVLRTLDRAGQIVRRSAGNCPRCYQVSPHPVYRCAGPHHGDKSELHHDIRPGLLGVFYRRCGCGRRLPTMVLRAARSMAALCPLCGADLHSGAGAATDVRVPVFGAPSSGKTHLVMASVVGLLRQGGDVKVSLADEHSKRTYTTFAAVIDGGGSAVKTDAAHPPIAITLRMQQGKRDALLHVYDAAGEALANPELNEKFQYLDAARTLVFVLDPFAIPDVRQRYQRTFADLFRTANVSADLPEPSYQNIVTRLRQYGVRTEQKRLAFVVSKRDLVQQLPDMSGLADDPDAVRSWLIDRGADNLVASAERDFGTVRFFFVSAKDSAAAAAGPLRPFRWLLEDEPVPKPVPQQATGHRAAHQYNRT
ncbi:TRAFAC clade GTPase domain-containing protein [Nucisporomicrobium flavum]|uniref:TRAFAC clade GTPase domain-containing protein n=1 Tax=Nucisporomicrobium flavum TaxID=2785915 RepID=UPI0018F63B7A|nr:hypothetical protein [Nucisporomicrobium flavum]